MDLGIKGRTALVCAASTGCVAASVLSDATGMGAAAVDANSILFPAGEAPLPVPSTATHFRCIRVGSADVAVQLETVQMMSES